MTPRPSFGLAGRLARFGLTSPITPLSIIGALLLGAYALWVTPREEEPQLDLTLATIEIPFPGASAVLVEQMATAPVEQLASQLPEVDHVMSVSRRNGALVSVQFKVGISPADAMSRLREVFAAHQDRLPADLGIGAPLIRSRSIDDVPVVTLALHDASGRTGIHELARIAHALEMEIKQVEGAREVETIGVPDRDVRIELDAARMKAAGVTVGDLRDAIRAANVAVPAGDTLGANRRIEIRAGQWLADARAIADLTVGIRKGKRVRIGDVSEVKPQAAAPERYIWFGEGPGGPGAVEGEHPAVVMQITKNRGHDASRVADAISKKMHRLRNTLIPASVTLTVTRNYGEAGVQKTTQLTLKLVFVTLAVILLSWLMLGWREAFIIGVAVVLTLALTLFGSWAIGYTLNRVSLFALIFAVGILVDDAIVVAENIHRHMMQSPGRPLSGLIPQAVDEVGGPTILATFAVVAALLPLLNVGGQLGPYVAPITILSSIGMLLSLLIAFVITPWMATWSLKPVHRKDRVTAVAAPLLHRLITPFLDARRGRLHRRLLFASVPLLMVLACLPLAFQWVVFRTMPFENRAEFQLVVDMPPDAPPERTAALLRELGRFLATVPEVRDYQAYAGLSAPIDFNGLARQYEFRKGGEFGSLQVNLVGKHQREASGHAIAARLRAPLHRIAARHGAQLRVAEPPPGPPSLASIVAEVYGPDHNEARRIAREIRGIFASTADMVDVFDTSIEDAPSRTVVIDRRKASALGVSDASIAETLQAGLSGSRASYLYVPDRYPVPLRLQLPAGERAGLDQVLRLPVRGIDAQMLPISELVEIEVSGVEQPIYHKDLRPVVYVGGDLGGLLDSPIYGMFAMREAVRSVPVPGDAGLQEYLFSAPDDTQNRFSVRWEGEWRLTYETFRDLGAGFVLALVLIYLLMAAHFGAYTTPLVIMLPIPLTIIGVLPGHLLTGAQLSASTAVGMLALAGIIVRNSILLVDFIEIERARGASLKDAVIRAPVARAKPILMTAIAAMLSGYFCLGDQFFDGLGTSLIFGVMASTLLTLILIPILVYSLAQTPSAATGGHGPRDV